MYDGYGEPIIHPMGLQETEQQRLERELDNLTVTDLMQCNTDWLDTLEVHPAEDDATRTNTNTQLHGKAFIALAKRSVYNILYILSTMYAPR